MSKARTATIEPMRSPGPAKPAARGGVTMKDNAAPAPATASAPSTSRRSPSNLARMVEEGGKALAAYLKPREEGQIKPASPTRSTDMVKTLGRGRRILAVRPAARGRTADRSSAAPISICGRGAVKRMAGEDGRPGRRARPEATSASPIRNGRRTSSSISSSRPTCSPRTGPTIWSRTPTASTRTRARRPSSTSGRSPTRCRRRTSC